MTIRTSSDGTHSAFRLVEKHFKSRATAGIYPQLHEQGVLDLSRPEKVTADEVWQAGWWAPPPTDNASGRKMKRHAQSQEREKGIRPEMECGGCKRISLGDGRVGWVVAEGCILIPNYLDTEEQLDLLVSALSEYTLPPNPLSLDTHYQMPPNLFEKYATSSPDLIQPRHASDITSPADHVPRQVPIEPKKATSRRRNDTEPASVLGYAEILARGNEWVGDEPSEKVGAKGVEDLMRELRWANLGWVYQWSTKNYNFATKVQIPFPTGLQEICTSLVKSIPWTEVYGPDTPEWGDYEPDTGIVNFYQMKDTLMGHVDRAELDPSRPLVSLSLGHAAIFLLGSSSREDRPLPIILRSGDALIMSGRGRQFYHGVPRIMVGTLPLHFQPVESDSVTLRAAKRFISTARININARQVFPPGFVRP